MDKGPAGARELKAGIRRRRPQRAHSCPIDLGCRLLVERSTGLVGMAAGLLIATVTAPVGARPSTRARPPAPPPRTRAPPGRAGRGSCRGRRWYRSGPTEVSWGGAGVRAVDRLPGHMRYIGRATALDHHSVGSQWSRSTSSATPTTPSAPTRHSTTARRNRRTSPAGRASSHRSGRPLGILIRTDRLR